MNNSSPYTRMIRETAARNGFLGTNPDQIEAWIRLEHSTLDGLSRKQFDAEVIECAKLVRDHPTESAQVARSFGF